MSNPYMSACLCVYTYACLSMYVMLVCGMCVCVSPFLGIFDSVNQGLNIVKKWLLYKYIEWLSFSYAKIFIFQFSWNTFVKSALSNRMYGWIFF